MGWWVWARGSKGSWARGRVVDWIAGFLVVGGLAVWFVVSGWVGLLRLSVRPLARSFVCFFVGYQVLREDASSKAPCFEE